MRWSCNSFILFSVYKLIILDEADAMTKDAQNALRRIIEKFSDNVRLVFDCEAILLLLLPGSV